MTTYRTLRNKTRTFRVGFNLLRQGNTRKNESRKAINQRRTLIKENTFLNKGRD